MCGRLGHVRTKSCTYPRAHRGRRVGEKADLRAGLAKKRDRQIDRKRQTDRDRQTDTQTDTQRDRTRTRKLYKDCSLGSVKNLSNN